MMPADAAAPPLEQLARLVEQHIKQSHLGSHGNQRLSSLLRAWMRGTGSTQMSWETVGVVAQTGDAARNLAMLEQYHDRALLAQRDGGGGVRLNMEATGALHHVWEATSAHVRAREAAAGGDAAPAKRARHA